MKLKNTILAVVAASILAVGGTTAANAVDVVPYGAVGACSNQASGVKFTKPAAHKATLQNCNASKNVRVQFKYELYTPSKSVGYSACTTLTPGKTTSYTGWVSTTGGSSNMPVGWRTC